MGCMTNVMILFFGMCCTFLGMTLPTDEDEMVDDKYWRLVYAFPIIPMTIQIIL
jgi:hypothetical protein